MDIIIKEFSKKDIPYIKDIWNEVIEDGEAFPQIEKLKNDIEAENFFYEQSFTATAFLNEKIVGMYILHPNNVGRCSHIANSSYAVKKNIRGKNIGRTLVNHSLKKAKELNFKILQFNAVVATNKAAIHLYEDIGFKKLGVIPGGFLKDNNKYEDIISYIYEL